LFLGLATAAGAAVVRAPLAADNGSIIRVAEGCGPGWWRGPGGRCHPFATGRLCPPGYHIGPFGRRCWPN
jgi:hypothetical protein